jgi:short-subunit dehydrogenase
MSEESTMSEAVAIITGASRGIGPHIARAFATAGHPVVLAARTGPLLDTLAQEIIGAGGRAIAVEADVTAAADRSRIVDAARSFGRVGVLVNNAAVGPIFHFHEHTTDQVTSVIDVNLMAPIELTRLVIPEMLDAGGGRIVNVTTVAAKLPMPYMVLYSTTKAALTQFSAALELEYGDRGIHVRTVLPGGVAEEGMSVRAAQESGVDLPDDGAVQPAVVARAVLDAARGRKPEVFVGTGTRFMTDHPRLAYRLIRKSGAFAALEHAADRFRDFERSAA